MKLITFYSLSKPELTLSRASYPMKFKYSENVQVDIEIKENANGWELRMSEEINSAKLKVAESKSTYVENLQGEKIYLKVIDVSECNPIGSELPKNITNALTFLYDSKINMSIKISEAYLEPENEKEQKLLESFETKTIRQPGILTIQAGMSSPKFDASAILHLIPKTIGLEIYAQAISTNESLIQFRELWRVLESAFTLTDEKLCKTLSKFQPVMDVPLSYQSIKNLLVLRGRASHANSKKGANEARALRVECEENLSTLKNLVSIVIDHKSPWGNPSLEYSNAFVNNVRNSFNKIVHKIDQELG